MINLNLNDDHAAQEATNKLHLGAAGAHILRGNHPTHAPAMDDNSLLALAFGTMPHPMSSAEISNRNVRR